MTMLEGRCLCGTVAYRVDEGTERVGAAICHCTDCRRQTGTAWSCIVGVPESAFHVEGASLASFETVGEDTHSPVERQFCSSCGSPIVSRPTSTPGVVWIKAGTLDDPDAVTPQVEVWSRSSVSWAFKEGTAAERMVLPRGIPAADSDAAA
jgi:hypothetical protein